jgi:hypothetical protein
MNMATKVLMLVLGVPAMVADASACCSYGCCDCGCIALKAERLQAHAKKFEEQLNEVLRKNALPGYVREIRLTVVPVEKDSAAVISTPKACKMSFSDDENGEIVGRLVCE